MKTKIIPFDLETVKKIQAGEIEGKIVRNGCKVVILGYNSEKYPKGYPIRIAYLGKDEVDYVAPEGLHIEVPDNEPQFKPFDKVLVREQSTDEWKCDYFSHAQNDGVCTYYVCIGGEFLNCIPYEGNEHLVGTTDKPKGD